MFCWESTSTPGAFGPTLNDPCDTDIGPNGLQNFPVLTSVSISGGTANITGKLNSTANSQFYLEFFSNSSEDPSGFGEGQTFIGSTIVSTDGGCNAGFTVNLAVPDGQQSISATATDLATGSTSEFSGRFASTTTLVSDNNPSAFGQSVTFTATVSGIAGTPVPTGTVTFGDGDTVLCTANLDGVGQATCTTSSLSIGLHSIIAAYNSDDNFKGSTSGPLTQLVYGYAAGGGSFVIGNGNAAVGGTVTFWGAQWASLNTLSGGSAPSSFKGFANQTSSNPAACGGTWTTRPGNSPGPPSSIPSYMAVIVASSASKSGSTISGNTTRVVVVRTNPGYDANPGHAGTGTVVAVVCP